MVTHRCRLKRDGTTFEHAEKYFRQHIAGWEKQARHLEKFIREHPGLSESQKQRAISAIRFARDTDLVSTVVKTTGTSIPSPAFPKATVLLMIPWRSKLLVPNNISP